MTKSILLLCAGSAVTWALAAATGATAGEPPGDRLITTLKRAVGPKGPTHVFKLYATPAHSNFRYRIDVCEADGIRVLQSEEFRNGVSLEGETDAFRLMDVNDDGYLDIKVLGGRKAGGTWYKTWLYDPAQRQFVWRTMDH